MALFSRVFEYLDLVPDVPAPAHPVALDPASVRGDVRVEGVTLRYPGADRDAVADLTLSVPAGSTLALVGPTGSGKSTVAGLLARLHDPDAGRVTVDGIDVRDLDPDVLASVVGVVSQESYLVHASVRDNLLLARPAATEGELWAALAAAQVADLVASLPDGLETVVGARGHRFSGGEQQRLAVARTILRDPPVLVLDEATSALDTTTERALQRALDELARGRTTITIAHRLSTVRDADRIAVLDGGRLVESGTHDELVPRWPVRGPGRGDRAGPRRLTLPGAARRLGRSSTSQDPSVRPWVAGLGRLRPARSILSRVPGGTRRPVRSGASRW